MKNTNKETIKAKGETLARLGEKINKTIDEAFDLICEMVRENGGLIRTYVCYDKPTIYAHYEPYYGQEQDTKIYALRWDDELGLTICTSDMLVNYEYDTKDYFGAYDDFYGEDLERIEKVVADPAYFVEFDKYELIRRDTIFNLIAYLPAYL